MSTSATLPFIYIDEATVGGLLTWPLVYHAVEQALLSVVDTIKPSSNMQRIDRFVDLPTSVQKPRTRTTLPDQSGILITMPGYIGDYSPQESNNSQLNPHQQTLGCKLVTAFQANALRQPPQPTIAATIVLFDGKTGQLAAILQATHITTWRTVAASLVATRHLWFERNRQLLLASNKPITLAIIGCGVEGRAHAIGMATTFPFAVIRLWNRTASKAATLRSELLMMRTQFCETEISVHTAATVADCVRDADVIVTATYAQEPLLRADMIAATVEGSRGVHINAIGSGTRGHFAELSADLYERVHIYCDSIESARVELHDMPHPIVGTVGDVIAGQLARPAADALTVFQSLGMAMEDCAVAQAVLNLYTQHKMSPN